MFYFFILSNFKPVIIGHTWQEGARRIPLNLIEYYIWYMCAENNCAQVVLNKQRCLLSGYFFQIRGSWKSWGHRFFSVRNVEVSTWNKQEIIGWLQYFTEICVHWQAPCKLSTLRSMGVALLVSDNTAVSRGCHYVIQFLIIKYGGHKILPRYLWKLMNPYSKVWWPHNSLIYVFFDQSNFKKLKNQWNLI